MDIVELNAKVEQHHLKLVDHDVRLRSLEEDRTLVHDLVEQTRALAGQASEVFAKLHDTLDEIAERAVDKVLHRRAEEDKQRREERREGWRYRLVWLGFLATAAYTAFTLLHGLHRV